MGNGLGELRIFRIIGLAAHNVHGETRHAQLLVAGGVELGELGDGRHLAQEPQSIEAPLLQRAGRPRQLCGPADLGFDLADELADLGRRGFSLFALNADQRGFVFLIGEPDRERAVGDKRDQNDREQQRDVLEE